MTPLTIALSGKCLYIIPYPNNKYGLLSADRSKAVVPVLVLLCCFVVHSTRRFVVCLSMCHFVLVFFSPFGVAITSLGGGRGDRGGGGGGGGGLLVLFVRLFDLCLFGFVGFLFLLGSGKGFGL